MFGIILVIVGTFFDETTSSIGKWEVAHRKEGMYTYGFLNTFWILILLLVLVAFRGNFVFSLKSLPLFGILAVLEMAQTYSTLHAIMKVERSTFGFLMVGTIPLLAVVDTLLGHHYSLWNVIGMGVIISGLGVLLINHGINKKGIGYAIFSTINAVATISIFKYIITHYNSVEAQQIVMSVIALVFLFTMAKLKSHENPFRFIFHRTTLAHSISLAIGSIIISFAYLYAPAAIITSGKRGMSVIWAIVSGNKFFHEKHLVLKITSFICIASGLLLLIF